MTIAVCDMQSEDVAAQIVFWRNLNAVVMRHGVEEPNFKGFMADSAQANWNAVQIVYGSGDPAIRMTSRERNLSLPLDTVAREAYEGRHKSGLTTTT